MKKHLISLKIYATMHWLKLDLNIKVTFQQQKDVSAATNNTKNRKRKIIWFDPPYRLNISRNTDKKFFILLDKPFPKCISFIDCSTLIMSMLVIALLLTLRVINRHNKNILNEQEKPSPCNCRDKTSCPLNESCQHKNLVYSCKVSNPNIKHNHPHYTGLTEHTFKDRLYKRNNSFKYYSKRH